MAPDPAPPEAPVPTRPPGPRDKVRIRFRKDGSLRLLSHHDLLRTFERMLRRADLPFYRSQGFHPHPRLIFALSLPLGVIGRDEVVELELGQEVPPEEIHARLTAQVPPGLAILSVRRIGTRVGARVLGLTYGLTVPAERVPGLRERMAELLAASECLVERTKPELRRFNVRPMIRDLRLLEGPYLEMALWLKPEGTARPNEVLTLLGLGDLLDEGAVLERTRLELADDVPPTTGHQEQQGLELP